MLAPQRYRLLSVLRRWFCCCWFVVDCYPHYMILLLFDMLLLYVYSCFAIILVGKRERERERELAALLSLSSWCLVIVVWLFLSVPWVCLQFVIVILTYYFWMSFMRRVMALVSLHFCLVYIVWAFVTVQNSHVVTQMAIECHFHTGQCKRTGGCFNELLVAFFSTGGGVKGKNIFTCWLYDLFRNLHLFYLWWHLAHRPPVTLQFMDLPSNWWFNSWFGLQIQQSSGVLPWQVLFSSQTA